MELAGALGPPKTVVKNLTEVPQMKALWEKVLEDTGDPLLVHFLAKLIDVAHVPARDPVRLARAVQLYSARKIKFFRERPERFQSAVRTIAWGLGDCDDKARFVAASLRTMRVPVVLKFLHMKLPDGRQLGHVYPMAWLPYPSEPSRWVALESVREYPLGYDPENRARERGFEVRSFIIGDKGEDMTHI